MQCWTKLSGDHAVKQNIASQQSKSASYTYGGVGRTNARSGSCCPSLFLLLFCGNDKKVRTSISITTNPTTFITQETKEECTSRHL